MNAVLPTADIADLLEELRRAAEAVLNERETYTPSIVEYAAECLSLLEARAAKLGAGIARMEGPTHPC